MNAGNAAGPRGRRGRRPTQADVARIAGVSQTTVSLVLNDTPSGRHRVGAEVRDRVQRAIEITGYAANPVAQSLAGGRSSIIGVYTYEPVFPVSAGNFYHPFLEGMEHEAQRLGVDLLLFTSMAEGESRLVNGSGLRRLRVADGCVLLGRHSRPEDLDELLRQDFPFAFVGRREALGGTVPFAAAAYADATEQVVRHLLDLGHRRVALATSFTGHESVEDRARGYRRAMTTARRQPVTFELGDRPVSDLLESLLSSGITAVATSADLAAPLRLAALERGLSVPGDVSVARLGDPEDPEPVVVDWTGFLIPRQEMGAEAVRIVMRQLTPGDDTNLQTYIPCTVVEGTTVAPLDAAADRPSSERKA